jgi:hypothetical protein
MVDVMSTVLALRELLPYLEGQLSFQILVSVFKKIK